MTALFRLLPLRVWMGLGIVSLLLAGFGAYKWQEARANRAEARLAPVEASRDALDNVAIQTPQIRQEAAEKEAEVEKIEGSDTRLPDGYGASLERVRRGKRD